MEVIDVEVDDHDIAAFHRINKSKGKSKETIVYFSNREKRKRGLYNKKKLALVNTSAAGLGNNTKLFISENLMDDNKKSAFTGRKLKRLSLIQSTLKRNDRFYTMNKSTRVNAQG